jgi:hypothetical protein
MTLQDVDIPEGGTVERGDIELDPGGPRWRR